MIEKVDVAPASNAAATARDWTRVLADYREPNHARSVFELLVTAIPFIVLWVLTWALLERTHWLSLVLVVPAAGLLARLFMIQHDCGHGAFFRSRRMNDLLGRALGVLTLTPYDHWKRTHAVHHATSGHLDRRGMGDITTLTVQEYLALPRLGRLRYRLYRHPLVMFGFGPAYLFLLQHRLPVGLMRRGGWRPWISAMGTNAGIAVLGLATIWFVGVGPFLLIHLPIVVIAATIGVWLFYVQHQFEDTYWSTEPDWSVHEAALHGSSHYDLPRPLRWLTANIGIHHVHHLASRIPYYRLTQVLREQPELRDIGRLTLMESFRCVRLVLWDESRRRLVSFRQLRQLQSCES